jgi:hypothetical protein
MSNDGRYPDYKKTFPSCWATPSPATSQGLALRCKVLIDIRSGFVPGLACVLLSRVASRRTPAGAVLLRFVRTLTPANCTQ